MINILTYIKVKIKQHGKDRCYNKYGFWLSPLSTHYFTKWPKGFKPKKYRSDGIPS